MEKYVFKKYSSFVSNACLISSFSNLFYNCGSDIMESDIFFLGDGMRFDYQWDDNAKSLKDIVLFHDSNIMIQNFFEQINEKISIKKIPCGVNEEEFNIFIKKKIDEGVPVIIAINTEYIKYNGILHSRMLVYTHMLKYYEKNQEVLSKLKDIYIKWEAINYALLKNNLTNAPADKYDGLCESVLNLLDLEYTTYKGD